MLVIISHYSDPESLHTQAQSRVGHKPKAFLPSLESCLPSRQVTHKGASEQDVV